MDRSKVTNLPPLATANASRYASVTCLELCMRERSIIAESRMLTSHGQNS